MYDLTGIYCHFLKGQRRLTDKDVEIARLYGPLLKNVARTRTTENYEDFIDTAKNVYLPQHPLINNVLPVSIGRRFECFRLYLLFNDLPDITAWIVGANGQNSKQYKGDFNYFSERQKSQSTTWGHYIPDINQGMKEYDDFFDALLNCAFEKDKFASQHRIHNLLAELKIDKFADNNSKVIQRLGTTSVKNIIQPHRVKIKKHLLTKVLDNDLVEEAFELHLPGFKKLQNSQKRTPPRPKKQAIPKKTK